MKKTPTKAAPKKRGRPTKSTDAMEMICVSITPHQKTALGRDRSEKVRQALVLAGFPEQPITDKSTP